MLAGCIFPARNRSQRHPAAPGGSQAGACRLSPGVPRPPALPWAGFGGMGVPRELHFLLPAAPSSSQQLSVPQSLSLGWTSFCGTSTSSRRIPAGPSSPFTAQVGLGPDLVLCDQHHLHEDTLILFLDPKARFYYM